MIVLGIECTAHTFGVGIVNNKGEILADQRIQYRPKEGGIRPREAAQMMSEKGADVIASALKEAGVPITDIDAIAFSIGPGLGPCLRTGAVAARYLARKYEKPLVGVNHCIAHIEIGKLLCRLQDPLVVYLSGANTQIIALAKGRYRVFGETLDIGLGNLLDSWGRAMGIPFPAGPKIEELAKKGKKFIELPYTVKGSDLTFSGLYTAAVKAAERYPLEDVAYSLQEVAFTMTAEVAERALAHTEKKEVLLVGGVAANKRLQEIMGAMAEEHGASLHVVPLKYAADNGVMIAWTGLLMYRAGLTTALNETVNPRFRTDQVDVRWVPI
ncbi:MAG TPA: N(6)-L-threonylcarbamoyladenine synthase Kae1 [Euryarchaeota archaeon]|nr:N(6)-L-threonylcarbamoyladenine synthase Kae1 [Euryarchaeota archaeon]HIQ10047.1 N(6)-L-threonylcarbamoyladenine synthase Kae1 [Euryarchaeota archaeon]